MSSRIHLAVSGASCLNRNGQGQVVYKYLVGYEESTVPAPGLHEYTIGVRLREDSHYIVAQDRRVISGDEFTHIASRECDMDRRRRMNAIIEMFRLAPVTPMYVELTMPYIESMDLQQYMNMLLRTARTRSRSDPANIMREINAIMAPVLRLHDMYRVTHNDIKPDNFIVILDESGQYMREVKLIDFATAREFGTDVQNIPSGTLCFAPPETFRQLEESNSKLIEVEGKWLIPGVPLWVNAFVKNYYRMNESITKIYMYFSGIAFDPANDNGNIRSLIELVQNYPSNQLETGKDMYALGLVLGMFIYAKYMIPTRRDWSLDDDVRSMIRTMLAGSCPRATAKDP
jgi:serine/threonine protein kinase